MRATRPATRSDPHDRQHPARRCRSPLDRNRRYRSRARHDGSRPATGDRPSEGLPVRPPPAELVNRLRGVTTSTRARLGSGQGVRPAHSPSVARGALWCAAGAVPEGFRHLYGPTVTTTDVRATGAPQPEQPPRLVHLRGRMPPPPDPPASEAAERLRCAPEPQRSAPGPRPLAGWHRGEQRGTRAWGPAAAASPRSPARNESPPRSLTAAAECTPDRGPRATGSAGSEDRLTQASLGGPDDALALDHPPQSVTSQHRRRQGRRRPSRRSRRLRRASRRSRRLPVATISTSALRPIPHSNIRCYISQQPLSTPTDSTEVETAGQTACSANTERNL